MRFETGKALAIPSVAATAHLGAGSFESITPDTSTWRATALAAGLTLLFCVPAVAAQPDGGVSLAAYQSASLQGKTVQPAGTQIQQSAAALELQLAKIAPGKGWEKYLSCATLRNIQSASEQPDDSERPALQTLLERYQSIAADDKYAMISRLTEFQRTVGNLQTYLSPLSERTRQELRRCFRELDDQLQARENGEKWVTYFALPEKLLSDESTKEPSERTRLLFRRFTRVGNDETYAQVTAIAAFRPAYEALQRLVGSTDTLPPSPVMTPEVPTAGKQQPAAAEEASDPAQPQMPVGEKILIAVVDLDQRLATVMKDSEWPERLSLDELRAAVPVSSEQPATDDARKSMQKILMTYEAVAKDRKNATINELPEFRKTFALLQEYLKPRVAQPANELNR